MTRRPIPVLVSALALLPMLVAPAPADEAPTYERDIKPLLARKCAVCHNARKVDNLDLSGGLALDTFDAVRKGTEEHAVVQPGRARDSELFRRITATDEDLRMPLDDDPLPEDQRERIRRWIDAGAPRGEPVAASVGATDAPERPRPRRFLRSLDVVLPTDVKVP